ncbi:cryptochrome/photolyase family protein [Nocardioides sp. Bht2]|uniref:cryptochrome/photolyase family protein n=1 Tax=Nocardioides sp. Bht2 TaxID=3392297 RepID=UPI0039B3A5C1
MTAIWWLRRDLRLADQPALLAALEHGEVLPLFVRDPRLVDAGTPRRAHLEAALEALNRATGGAVVIRDGDPAQVVADVAAEIGAATVHVTGEFTPFAVRRDRAVAERLAGDGVTLSSHGTPYAVRPGTVLTGGGTPYQVFTPFSRAWRALAEEPPYPAPGEPRWHRGVATAEPDAELVRLGRGLGAAGEAEALARWHAFLDDGLADYAELRDRPDLDGTSRLSGHLKVGALHPRTLLAEIRAHRDADTDGAQTFITELAWREFYGDVLWHRPESAWADLKPALAAMPYDQGPQTAALVQAWREGRTGFPIVDAGMRQLRETGWMHNRVRMVVGSFLVKDLHVWWPVGARHFLDQLIDGDVAANNHGWQWVAGTGTDASPYFRVFNPVSQGKRFDPDGSYVRRWVPELAHLTGKAAHEPWRHDDGYAHGYPEQIVDHDEERREALARYEQARSQG